MREKWYGYMGIRMDAIAASYALNATERMQHAAQRSLCRVMSGFGESRKMAR
jgi:hypothetical protein